MTVAAPDIRSPGTSVQVIHASFDHHYISVSSSSSTLLQHIARHVEPMLSMDPTGERIASLHLSEAEGWVTAEDDQGFTIRWGDLYSAVRALHHMLIKRFIDARPELIWIHAGVVAFAGRALVFAARPGQGKSTLVAELLEWGCDYLSDEVAPIDPATNAVLPFPVSPWKRIPPVERVSADQLHKIPKVCVRLAPTVVSLHPVSLGQIFFLRHMPQVTGTSFVRCSPSIAVLELSDNSFNSQDSRATELARLCNIASRFDTFHLEYAQARGAARDLIQAASLA
jgi:hypothetical protein